MMYRLTVEALNKMALRYKGGSVWQMSAWSRLRPKAPADDPPVGSVGKTPRFHCSLCFSFVRYVFFLEPCKLDIINRKVASIALCVSRCPTAELKTYNDLTQFAFKNGENSQEASSKSET